MSVKREGNDVIKPELDLNNDGRVDTLHAGIADEVSESFIGKGLKIERVNRFGMEKSQVEIKTGNGLDFNENGELVVSGIDLSDIQEQIDTAIDTRLDAVELNITQRLGEFDTRIAGIEANVTTLQTNVNAQLQNMQNQINSNLGRLNELDDLIFKVDNMTQTIINLSQAFNDVNDRLDQLENNSFVFDVDTDTIQSGPDGFTIDQSTKEVTFATPMSSTEYSVIMNAENDTVASVGEVYVYDKTVNGFKFGNTGEEAEFAFLVIPPESVIKRGTGTYAGTTQVTFDAPYEFNNYAVFITTSEVTDAGVGEVAAVTKSNTGFTVTNTGDSALTFDYVAIPYSVDTDNFEIGSIVTFANPTTVALTQNFDGADYEVLANSATASYGALGDIYVQNKTTTSFDLLVSGSAVGQTIDYIAFKKN